MPTENPHEKSEPEKPGWMELLAILGLLAALAFGIHREFTHLESQSKSTEITLAEYSYLEIIIEYDPATRAAVKAAARDGKITREEFVEIQRAKDQRRNALDRDQIKESVERLKH